jgi:hypothetical protein
MPLDVIESKDKLLAPPKSFRTKIQSYIMSYDDRDPDSTTQKSSSDQEKVYEKTKEYFKKKEIIEINTLRKARWWLLIVLSYWIVRFFLIIRPKYRKYDNITKVNVYVQGAITISIFITLVFTKAYHLKPIKYLLYIQAIQMSLMNFNIYEEEDTINFHGLNTLSTVFSVLFAVFNTFLAAMIFDNNIIKLVMTFTVFGFVSYSVIYSSFVFGDLTYHTTVSLVMSIIYTCMMIPAFGYISSGI